VLRQNQQADRRYHLIALALSGKKEGFADVIKQIHSLTAMLRTEQTDDDKKKTYCASAFDKTEDEQKGIARAISDTETVLSETKGSIDSVQAEIEALTAGIQDLDKQVSKQTDMRQEEHSEHTETMSANNAAVSLLEIARNRLNKFYNPKLAKAPPKRKLSEEERITVNMGGSLAPTAAPGGIAGTGIDASFLQLSADATHEQAEADLGYNKKTGESAGVIQMIDMLIQDLSMENEKAELDENYAQTDYEAFVKESGTKRAEDSKGLADKEGAKAELEGELERSKSEMKSQSSMLKETNQEIANLHGECDWLLKNYDIRKEARSSESEALTKATSVLKGASL